MNLKSLQNYDNKWKEKYLLLLEEHKIQNKQAHTHEELLCKAVIRLTLATKGLDKQLDPYLDRVHRSVKSNLTYPQLQTDLDELIKAIQPLIRKKSPIKEDEAALLFDYLIRQYADKTSIQAINSVRQKYQANEFNSIDDLFSALLDATVEGHSAAMANLPGAQDLSGTIKTEAISDQLLLLLDNLNIPLELEEKAEQLKIRLQNFRAPDLLEPLLNDYVALFVSIKNHIRSEQKDIENFLSQITEQLVELGLQASGAKAAAHKSNTSRKRLDQYVSKQMHELQHSSDNAATLENLKQLIHTRLDSITRQIQQHRINEEKQRLHTQQQLNELSSRIEQMESESSDLRSKLAIAHDKARRDPLTGLANRIAYNERVKTEISRWQRYQSPLSLVICDIDKFKSINDTFGHRAGDKTLKIIAQLLTRNCRGMDFLSRFGGEEFTLLLPNTSKESALVFANKLRLIIGNTRFNYGARNILITISCGISEFKEGDTAESVFERADQALYSAKNSGRNQCSHT